MDFNIKPSYYKFITRDMIAGINRGDKGLLKLSCKVLYQLIPCTVSKVVIGVFQTIDVCEKDTNETKVISGTVTLKGLLIVQSGESITHSTLLINASYVR